MRVTLKVSEGRPRTVAVEPPERAKFVIGRGEDCDLRLASPLVSRHHCVLTVQDGRIFVRDLESSNGTGVNNQILVGQRPLRDGDELWVAATPVTVRIQRDRNVSTLVDEVFRKLWRSRGAPPRSPQASGGQS